MKILIDLPVRSAGRPNQRTEERKTAAGLRTYRTRRMIVLGKAWRQKGGRGRKVGHKGETRRRSEPDRRGAG